MAVSLPLACFSYYSPFLPPSSLISFRFFQRLHALHVYTCTSCSLHTPRTGAFRKRMLISTGCGRCMDNESPRSMLCHTHTHSAFEYSFHSPVTNTTNLKHSNFPQGHFPDGGIILGFQKFFYGHILTGFTVSTSHYQAIAALSDHRNYVIFFHFVPKFGFIHH